MNASFADLQTRFETWQDRLTELKRKGEALTGDARMQWLYALRDIEKAAMILQSQLGKAKVSDEADETFADDLDEQLTDLEKRTDEAQKIFDAQPE